MKINSYSCSIAFTLLSASLTTQAFAGTIACQNYTSAGFLCMHNTMPILSQADTSNGKVLVNGVWTAKYPTNRYNYTAMPNRTAASFSSPFYNMGLLEYVNLQQSLAVGKPYTEFDSWDPGWCGAVSSAMILRTYGLESGKLGTAGGVYIGTPNVNQLVYQVMKLVKTNITSGGTFLTTVNDGFNLATANHSAVIRTFPTQQSYAKTIPLLSVPIFNKAGSHFIVVHGMEGLNYVINDPWGSVYTVKFNSSNSTLSFLSYISKGYYGGDLPTYGTSSEFGMAAITGYTPVATSPLISGLANSIEEVAPMASLTTSAAVGENNGALP